MKTTYHLGIMSYSSHDPSAAIVKLFQDGTQIDCSFIHFEEGMLSRKKKSFHFPTRSISSCLDHFGIGISQLTTVRSDFMDNQFFNGTSWNYRRLVGDYIRKHLNITKAQISKPIHHHEAHAISSWVGSGFEDAAFLAIDGLGSLQSTHSVFVSNGKSLEKIFSQTTPGIGVLYSLITELIGFKEGDEGKTMGLAPYGEIVKNKLSLPSIDFQGVYGALSVDYSKIVSRSPNKYLLTDFGINQNNYTNLYEDFRAYLAFEIQQELERCLLYLTNQIKDVTGKDKLCLSGGVALNCVANEKIVQNKNFEEIFVFPDSADSGIVVGLAFSSALETLHSDQISDLFRVYKHPKFSPESSVPIVNSKILDKIQWNEFNTEKIVDEIEKSTVVALFQGGWEYGPRALGRRSFIASATNPNMKEVLNAKIKHRESFRPFAPICLIEDFDQLFISSHKNHEFMTYAVEASEKAKTLAPAIVHVDGTSRVQIATKECGLIFELLHLLKARTGIGILVNTSFNDNNEPIVMDELDALNCFLKTNAGLLVVNKKMISREDINMKFSVSELLTELELEIFKRNHDRFKSSLHKILQESLEPLQIFLDSNLKISEYHKKNSSRIRFLNLLSEIKNGNLKKFNRILISSHEVNIINFILNEVNCLLTEFSDTVEIIEDNFSSVDKIRPGDLVVSYNLSNILRDLKQSTTFTECDYENFYRSEDYRILMKSHKTEEKNQVIDLLADTYENRGDLSIESIFHG